MFTYLYSHVWAIKIMDGNFAPPHLTCPSPLCSCGFFPPRKGGGAGMGQDFSPTLQGKAGWV